MICPHCNYEHDANYESDLCNSCGVCMTCETFPEDPPEDMDGDHQSGLASAGWGTDEDYGMFEDPYDDQF